MKGKVTCGQLIKKQRTRLECSQEALATHLGVSVKFVSLVERGERGLPVEHFQNISEFLEIPMGELIRAKVYDEDTKLRIRQIQQELFFGCEDEVSKAISLNQVKEYRVQEIDELVKFLNFQLEDYKAQIKAAQIHKKTIERQISILIEEKEELGFGQSQMNLEAYHGQN